jgi:nucleoside-diphosphate-sugar epimerase
MLKSMEGYNFQRSLTYFDLSRHNLNGARIIISGASGFVGNWVSELLFQIAVENKIDFEVVLLTRNEEKLRKKFSGNVPKNFSIQNLDVSKKTKPLGFASHVIHAATPTFQGTGGINEVEEASLGGAENLLNSISLDKQKPIFLNLSSGAVYGLNELSQGAISLSRSVSHPALMQSFADLYASSKIKTEQFINEKTSQGLVIGCNPRLFAFFGPLLPTNQKYAIGNFMNCVNNFERINLNTQGESVRSFLHASSLASQLVHLLSNPIVGESHIGSSFSKPLKWWAEYLTEIFGLDPISFGDLKETPTYYAPETDPRIPEFELGESEREFEFRYWNQWLNRENSP